MNNLELKSIEDIQGMSFFIPSYQRGYRWTKQQVVDLLEDIKDFTKKGSTGIYCIQPLVVKQKHNEDIMQSIKTADSIETVRNLLKGQWEVVDGQQRLTTIFLILTARGLSKYSIQYETREKSETFLQEIQKHSEKIKDDNIDYHHMWNAYSTITDWFDVNQDIDLDYILQKQVKFIWYEIGTEEHAKQVFARLNIGKIALTNAELIKALLLNKSNFSGNQNYSEEEIRMRQQEIAIQWDTIEYSLQSRDFWLFLNNIGDERATRIEYIFDLIAENDLLKCSNDANDSRFGELRTFRYFSYYIEKQNNHAISIKTIWNIVMEIFMTFKEWFDEKELYHYIGFLICCGKKMTDIYEKWKNSPSKSTFRNGYLIEEIKKCLGNKDFAKTKYEGYGDGGPKTKCKPILLLHNIQTVINQNKVLSSNDKYGQGVFYKFPFHLYKSEMWDIEHIDSNTENALNDIKSQREWLLNSFIGLNENKNKKLRDEIQNFFSTYLSKSAELKNSDDWKKKRDEDFEKLRTSVETSGRTQIERLNDEEKNMIWNFVLLDSSTNRSYGNSIFPAKRRIVMGKEQGKWFAPPTLDEQGNIIEMHEEDNKSSFIAPCTRYVFMKYYDSSVFSPNEWNKEDAKLYLNDILKTLKDFV